LREVTNFELRVYEKGLGTNVDCNLVTNFKGPFILYMYMKRVSS